MVKTSNSTMKVAVILFLALICAVAQCTRNKRIVCYYQSASVLRAGNGKFALGRILPQLCTHLVYGFATISPNGTVAVLNPTIDLSPQNGLKAFTDLVHKSHKVISMISLLIPSSRSALFSSIVGSASRRETFIHSLIEFLKQYNFLGVDIMWFTIPKYDKANFVTLLKEIREAFKKYRCHYFLSVSLTVDKLQVVNSYDLPGISRHVNHINLHTFLNVVLAGKTTHPSPYNDVVQNVQLFIKGGANRNLLVVGIAAAGKSYTLRNASIVGPEVPVSGEGLPGPYLNLRGLLAYNEICSSNFVVQTNALWKAPFGVRGNQWVGFDDRNSVTQKCHFVQRNHLGGGMLWSMDMDDFSGQCGLNTYPLLRAMLQHC